MVPKRWFFILITAWLVNTLVCFHPTNFIEGNNSPVSQTSAQVSSDNTLVDIFFNHVASDDHDQHEHHKINHRRRYINTRTIDFNIQLPAIDLLNYLDLIKAIPNNHIFPWVNRFLLPPLHHFLFRLSPF
ncbi:hypothetical protein ACFQZI_00360 [Mucilaginibacter lutimaris]|uniref:Uncharacterized protein n=1 Tax=Mucilaginibacter lutimaris TaxID=931629 RepID=A0ABW2Z8Z0_9SPHI